MEAISNAGAAIGMLCKDGVVLVAEKKITSKLLDTHAVGVRREKMYKLDDHVCCAVAGITGVDEGFANVRQGHLPCNCLCYCWSQHRHSSVMLKVLAAASSCKQLRAAAQQQLDSTSQAHVHTWCSIHSALFTLHQHPGPQCKCISVSSIRERICTHAVPLASFRSADAPVHFLPGLGCARCLLCTAAVGLPVRPQPCLVV